MMPEGGHAPATVETELYCYDCSPRELPSGAVRFRLTAEMQS